VNHTFICDIVKYDVTQGREIIHATQYSREVTQCLLLYTFYNHSTGHESSDSRSEPERGD